MRVLPKPIAFKWDKGNLDKNWVRHSVTNKEAEEAFENEPKFIFKDEKHSVTEARYMLWGLTNSSRRLAVIFTLREDKVRVISARDMHKKERESYAEKVKANT